jgi:Flp pilus assembly protein TadB
VTRETWRLVGVVAAITLVNAVIYRTWLSVIACFVTAVVAVTYIEVRDRRRRRRLGSR